MIAIIKRLTLAVVLPAALVVGCGGGTKKQDPTTNTHSSSTPAAHYRMGESCKSNEDLAYSAQGFVCKNGKLAHKSSQTAPATTTHQHTTTSAPQGY